MILIQARTNSTRFPNKIMEKLDGQPLLRHSIDRASLSGYPAMVLIPTNDPVKEYLQENYIPYFEGSELNVLNRYYSACKSLGLNWCVRITADSPLISPAQISFIIQLGKNNQADFVTNCLQECTDGQEVEFISFKMLEHLKKMVNGEKDQEHVTIYIKKNWNELEKNFRMISYCESLPIGSKMSVDTPEDFKLIKIMYEQIKNRKKYYV